MASEVVVILGPITIVVILAAIYLAFPRYGQHLTSRLTCPKCAKTFDYEWLPGGSFTAIRLGKKRYMRCKLCHKWAMFDVFSNIVSPQEDEESEPSEST